MMPTPDPHVTQERPILERGDVVTDPNGSKWRVVVVLTNGTSRVRVGSLAEEAIFGIPSDVANSHEGAGG